MNSIVFPLFTVQQSDCEKSISFCTLRVRRSSSAAASVRIEFLSGVTSFRPLVGVRGEPVVFMLPPGVPGVPAFLLSKELKKLARTPSPPAAPGVNFGSIYFSEKKNINFIGQKKRNDWFDIPKFVALFSPLPVVFALVIHLWFGSVLVAVTVVAGPEIVVRLPSALRSLDSKRSDKRNVQNKNCDVCDGSKKRTYVSLRWWRNDVCVVVICFT